MKTDPVAGNGRVSTRTISKTTRGLAVLVIGLSAAGCRETPPDQAESPPEPEASVELELSELARESGLALVDLSIPLDRFAQAPAALERLATSLAERTPGIYVMRYYDDTLRSTAYVFETRSEGIRYLTLTSVAGGELVREETSISGVVFDAETATLVLTGELGSIRLTPQDVTPAGA